MTTTQIRCPGCQRTLTVDPHWTAWCPTCDWGLDPAPEDRSREGRLARWWRARLNRRSEVEHQRLLVEGLGSARSADRALVTVTATAVHLMTLALLVVTVLVALSSWLLVLRIPVVLVLLALVWQVSPRPFTDEPEGVELTRTSAPRLFGLVDRLAVELQVSGPDVIVVDDEVNAFWGHLGWRRRRVLGLGLPLWAALDGPGRVALIGHELGHEANGDPRNRWWVQTALRSVFDWLYLLAPDADWQLLGGERPRHLWRTDAVTRAAELVLAVALAPFLLLLAGLSVVLGDVSNRAGQRAEHVADRFGAELAGTDAAVASEQALLAPELLTHALEVALRRDPKADLWEAARTFQASIPDSERERRFRLAARTLQSVDATHPPTHRRLELLAALPHLEGSYRSEPEEERAIDAELRQAENWVRTRLRERNVR